MKTLFRCVLVLFFYMVMVNSAYADVYYEMEREETYSNSNTHHTRKHKNYLTDNYWRTDSEGGSDGNIFSIIEFESGVSWSCNDKYKTCQKTIDSGFDKSDQNTEETDNTKSTPTNETKTISGETKTISGYDCKMYNFSLISSNVSKSEDVCMSKNVHGYRDYRRIMMKLEKMWRKSSYLRKRLRGRAEESDGFPVQSVQKIKGQNGLTIIIKETVKLIQEKPLDRNLFKIPDGYKVDVNVSSTSEDVWMSRLEQTNKELQSRRRSCCFIGTLFSEEESE